MEENISRSEKKRQFKQTEQVAMELAEFSDNELKKLPCTDELKEEIRNCRGLKAGARKRQVKYLAKVMRLEPLEDIYDFLAERKGSDLKSKKKFHEAERLRDSLINEAIDDHDRCMEEHVQWDMDWPSSEIAGVLKRYPSISEGEVRKAVYSYVKTRNRLHYRELFRMLKAGIDLVDMKTKIG
ncbi:MULTISPECIES: ribosome biogenesis factor YjgA [Desulfosediminicola]|uniref:ribosome biogenesis factor YjgA n=1 Tax=Desulfosediminicola TaxID=2886823 RepID=UPI0010ABE149|nr:ribosome biogenesis factor YjgA [Desulfosediminicola ganghwensis]